MKKLFQLSLMILLLVAGQALISHNAGPVFSDAAVQCDFVPAPQVDCPLAFAVETPYQVVAYQGDVEKSPSMFICRNNQSVFCPSPYESAIRDYSAPKGNQALYGFLQSKSDRIEGVTRLDIGENSGKRV